VLAGANFAQLLSRGWARITKIFPGVKPGLKIREFDPAPHEERGERWRQRLSKTNCPRKKLVKYQRV